MDNRNLQFWDLWVGQNITYRAEDLAGWIDTTVEAVMFDSNPGTVYLNNSRILEYEAHGVGTGWTYRREATPVKIRLGWVGVRIMALSAELGGTRDAMLWAEDTL